MSSPELQNLPPEMQARLAAIVNGMAPGMVKEPQAPAPQPQAPQPQAPQPQWGNQQAPAPAAQTPDNQAPAQPKPPSLYEQIVALRQELAAVAQVQQANSQVTTAIGQAVGQMYQWFQPTHESAQAGTYSQSFQTSSVNAEDSDY
jgi:hypothetical protein